MQSQNIENLNPDNLKDIEYALRLPPERRLWFFIHDAIPNVKHTETLYYDQQKQEFTSLSCVATDMLFGYSSDPKKLDTIGHPNLKAYIPLIRSCYRPYKYHVKPLPLNDKEQQYLEFFIKHGRCIASINRISDESVAAVIYFSIEDTDINKAVKIYLNAAEPI